MNKIINLKNLKRICSVSVLVLSIFSFSQDVKASEITGTLNSGGTLNTGLTGTVAPASTPSSGGGNSGGGGGGGNTSNTNASTAGASNGGGGGGGGSSSNNSQLVTNPKVPVYSGPAFVFSKQLILGSVSKDVKNLQKFLNSSGYIIAKTGAGSLGHETETFGKLTKVALMLFQKDNKLAQTGKLDDKTIEVIEDLSAIVVNTANKTASSTIATNTETGVSSGLKLFTRDLKKGDTGADVKELQVFLNTHGYLIALTGAGSLGKETNSFGELTKKALASYQRSKGISATGFFGPITRAYIER